MGKVLRMKNNNVGLLKQFLESGVTASNIEKDGYEVVSTVVIDDDVNFYTVGEVTNKNSNQLYAENANDKFIDTVREIVSKCKTNFTVFETIVPDENNLAFYKLKCDLDIDLATELGFGVINHKGDLLVYSTFYEGDPTDVVYELMMMKVYLQLLNPDIIDESLRSGFERNEDVISSYMIMNREKHLQEVRTILGLV